jgi:hypothetical protein
MLFDSGMFEVTKTLKVAPVLVQILPGNQDDLTHGTHVAVRYIKPFSFLLSLFYYRMRSCSFGT